MQLALTFDGGTPDDLQENINIGLRDPRSFPIPVTIQSASICAVPDPNDRGEFIYVALLIVDDPSED